MTQSCLTTTQWNPSRRRNPIISSLLRTRWTNLVGQRGIFIVRKTTFVIFLGSIGTFNDEEPESKESMANNMDYTLLSSIIPMALARSPDPRTSTKVEDGEDVDTDDSSDSQDDPSRKGIVKYGFFTTAHEAREKVHAVINFKYPIGKTIQSSPKRSHGINPRAP